MGLWLRCCRVGLRSNSDNKVGIFNCQLGVNMLFSRLDILFNWSINAKDIKGTVQGNPEHLFLEWCPSWLGGGIQKKQKTKKCSIHVLYTYLPAPCCTVLTL